MVTLPISDAGFLSHHELVDGRSGNQPRSYGLISMKATPSCKRWGLMERYIYSDEDGVLKTVSPADFSIDNPAFALSF